jgi:hypothetical protein
MVGGVQAHTVSSSLHTPFTYAGVECHVTARSSLFNQCRTCDASTKIMQRYSSASKPMRSQSTL